MKASGSRLSAMAPITTIETRIVSVVTGRRIASSGVIAPLPVCVPGAG
jgi:hypothetical protein